MKTFLISFLSIFIFSSGFSQNVEWLQSGGGIDEDWVYKMVTDQYENLYVIGAFQDTATFGQTSLISAGDYDIFLAKYSPAGNLIWIQRFGSTGKDWGTGIAIDTASNIYITGYFTGTVQMGSLTLISQGGQDMYMAKLDSAGTPLWANQGASNSNVHGNFVEVDKWGNSYVSGQYSSTTQISFNVNNTITLSGGGYYLVKYNAGGSAIWAKKLGGTGLDILRDMTLSANGDIFLAGSFWGVWTIDTVSSPYASSTSSFLLRMDSSGTATWGAFPGPGTCYSVTVDDSLNCYFAGRINNTVQFGDSTLVIPNPNGNSRGVLAKFDANGEVEWVQLLAENQHHDPASIDTDGKGNLFLLTYLSSPVQIQSVFLTPVGSGDIGLLSYDTEGNFRWAKGFGGLQHEISFKIHASAFGAVYISAKFQGTTIFDNFSATSAGDYDMLVAKIHDKYDELNTVSGRIFNDINQNCIQDSSEQGLAGLTIVAKPGPYYAITDHLGDYLLRLDSGTYSISEILPSYIANSICPPSQFHQITFDSLEVDTMGIDFANNLIPCHNLTVNITSNTRRRCFDNQTYIDFCNNGPDTAFNAKVYVEFPAYVSLVSADYPYTIDADSNFVFDIGNVGPFECGQINITDFVNCTNPEILGLTQCTKVWVTPVSNCSQLVPTWSGASLASKPFCKGADLVEFVIHNEGTANMVDSTDYRIYVNDTLDYSGKLQLDVNDSLKIWVQSDGKTIRWEGDQVQDHPRNQWISSTFEACGLDSGFTVSKGYVNRFPQIDPEPRISVHCLPIIGSYDPNDKTNSPEGIGSMHYTKPNQRLDYLIRFQNTGTDTAFKVVVWDTLSPHLDFSTFELEATSHPYQVDVSGADRQFLTFTFDNILLPDSNVNEPESHGFIRFSILPKDSLANGTKIQNFAEIFFDFNPPIQTNTVTNTLWDTSFVSIDGQLITICGQDLPTQSYAGTDTSFCGSISDTLLISGNEPIEGVGRWKWVSGSGLLGNINSPNTYVTNLGAGDNILEWEISLCEEVSTSQITIRRDTIPDKPIITSLAGEYSFCEGDSLLLQAPSGFSQYYWSTGDQSQEIHIFQSSTIQLYVVDGHGCESPVSDSLTVTKNSLPATPSILQAGSDSLKSSVDAEKYYWYFNGSLLPDTTQMIHPSVNGTYTLGVESEFGCLSQISEAFDFMYVGISELNLDRHFLIYPNPASRHLKIEAKNGRTFQVSLVNIHGQEMLTGSSLNGAIQLDLSSFVSGLYFLQIEQEGKYSVGMVEVVR